MKVTAIRCLLLLAVLGVTGPALIAGGANYKNFDVAVYCRVYEVRQMKDPAYLENTWAAISKHVKVDKVYLETHRDTIVVDQETLDQAKRFFQSKGVKVAGGITVTINEANQFETYCYSNPEHRKKLQEVVEFTARNFDEFILDDFFFTSCKCDLCIRAKGKKSWTQFRLELMDEAGRSLVMKPARAVNPKVKVTIKYPNWYDHFQNLGFNLETAAEVLRQDLHRHRDARSGVQQPAPAAVPRLLHLPVLREHQAGRQRGRLGGLGRAPQPGSLRRTALADLVRQGAGDHALRHPAAVSAHPAGGRQRGAGIATGAPGRVRVRAGRRLRRQARQADRREDLQAVPLVRRGPPPELPRDDRHSDGHRARLPGGSEDRAADRSREVRPGDRGPDSSGSSRTGRTSSSPRDC